MIVLTLLGILVDASVRAEEAHARNARDRLGQPLILVFVRLVNGCMCLNVAVEVVRDKVVVAMVADSRDHGQEVVGLAECAALNSFEDLGKVRVDGVRAVCVRVAKILNILGEIAKEENVVLANLTGDLNL